MPAIPDADTLLRYVAANVRRLREKAELTQLSAEDILQDASTREMWLRGVQQDPSRFLAIKFNMQLQRQSSSADEAP